MTFSARWRPWVAGCVVAMACVQAQAGAYDDFLRAIEVDNDSGLRSLLARGMDPNTADERGQVALFLALRGGADKVVLALLQHPDTKLDAANAAGETPLMMAALRGNLAAVRALLDKGVPARREGWSALHYAATGPSADAVQLLLERGAEIDARSPNGSTPLMMAARYGSEASVVLLLQRGADRRLRNQLDLDAAAFARAAGRDALAQRLASDKP